MLQDGYQKEFAVGTVASAGCLGILVPPSIMLVLMADQMRGHFKPGHYERGGNTRPCVLVLQGHTCHR